MDGVIVRLEKDGKLLREYLYPGNLKAQWTDSGASKNTSN